MKNYSPRGKGQLLGASLLITVGVLILLVENQVISGSDLRRLWPMLLVLVGATKLRQGGSALFGGLVLISAGVLLELSAFNYIRHPERLWPLILVAAGLAMLWKAFRPAIADEGSGSMGGPFSWPAGAAQGGEGVAIFGGVERRVTDPEFAGMELTTIFGGYNLDLRKAQLKGGRAVITVSAVCGGVEIRIPESWDAEIAGSPIFGGFSDETQHPDVRTNPPRLVVQGSVVFGGVNVKN